MKRYILISCLQLCFLLHAGAQTSDSWTAGLVADQDILLTLIGMPNEDRNYTMGAGLFFSDSKLAKSSFFWPARLLSRVMYHLDKEDQKENAIIQIGATGFTPRYLGENVADSLYYIVNDRPFASLLFLSAKHQIISDRKVITNQLVLGAMGLHVARAVQTLIHEKHMFGSTREIPYGWKYQISNNFEPAILVSNKVDYLFDLISNPRSNTHPILAQAILSREIRLGYYTGASGSVAFKVGWLDRDRWASYDAYQLGHANKRNKPAPTRLQPEFYLLSSFRPNLVLYNAMLMGQFRDNYHDLSFGEMRKVVMEGFAGIGGTATFSGGRRAVNLLVYLSGRSPEHNLSLKRYHYWGGFQLSCSVL